MSIERQIHGIADKAGVRVVMVCNYCGHTGADVHENTQRTYAGTIKTIGVCDNIRACSERMVQAVQEKALAEAGLIRCGQAEQCDLSDCIHYPWHRQQDICAGICPLTGRPCKELGNEK